MLLLICHLKIYIDTVIRHTSGFGADGVIITAASPSDQIISDANVRRKKVE